MGVTGVNPAGSVQQLMDILTSGQEKSLDLSKKLIKLSYADKTYQNQAEGKGLNFDASA